VLETLEHSDLAVWIRESPSLFSYTLILSLHAIGLAMVVGTNTLVALRLLGVAPGIPLESLRRFYPVIWFGFWINAISGVLLFIAEATSMSAMPAFWGKLTFVFVGMVVGQLIRTRCLEVPEAAAGVVSAAGRRLAVVSLVCWYLALIVGRLTGYPELVKNWFGI
jgi:hypothetical protein